VKRSLWGKILFSPNFIFLVFFSRGGKKTKFFFPTFGEKDPELLLASVETKKQLFQTPDDLFWHRLMAF